jgi:hypothetical protein
MEIGQATAKAQLKYMVEPLEQAGLKVDIYLSGYGCTGLQHITKEQADDRYKQLVGWYGSRVVAHSVFDRDSVGQHMQDLGTQQAMMLLLKTSQVRNLEYHSVILWRYDMVPYVPMGPPNCDIDAEDCFKSTQDHVFQGADEPTYYWQNYALLANRQLLWFEDDWAYTFPGWFMNCAIGVFLHHCMAESTVCIRAMQLNFQGGWPFQGGEWKNIRGNDNCYIYRENYSLHGKQICKVLHTEFDGPPCPETGEEAWELACADVKSKGSFEHLNPNAVACGTVENRVDCHLGKPTHLIKSCEGPDLGQEWTKNWETAQDTHRAQNREKWAW